LALFSDNLGPAYSYIARNKRLAPKAREAAALFAVAEAHLSEEDDIQALQAAEECLALFRQHHDEMGIADSIRIIAHVYIYQGRRKEANKLVRDELERVRASSNRKSEGKLLLAVAEVNAEQRGPKNRKEALLAATEAQVLFRDSGDGKMEALSMFTLINIYLRKKGDKGKSASAALLVANEAVELFKESKDLRGEALSLHCVAAACVSLRSQGAESEVGGLPPGGWLQAARDALKLLQECGLRRLVIYEMLSIARWHLMENPRKALKVGEDVLELCRQQNSPQECMALGMVVQAHIGIKDTSKAYMLKEAEEGARLAWEGVARFRAMGDKFGEAQALSALILAHMARDETGEALRATEKAAKAYRALGDEEGECCVMQLSAQLYLKREQADKSYTMVEGMASISESFEEKAVAMEVVFEVHMQNREFEEALGVADKLVALAEKEGQSKKEASAKLLSSNAYFAQGEYDMAVSLAREAQASLHDLGAIKEEAQALRVCAEINVASRDLEAALRAAERCCRLMKESKNVSGQSGALFLVAQVRQMLLLRNGDITVARKSHNFHTDLEVALQAAQEAADFAKDNAELRLAGNALCCAAQMHMVDLKVDDALASLEQATEIFKTAEDERGQAAAMCIEADARLMGGAMNKAKAVANRALTIFRAHGDGRGEFVAKSIISYIEGPTDHQQGGEEPQWSEEQWKQWEQYQMQQGGEGEGGSAPSAASAPPAAIAKKVREKTDSGMRLDMANLNPEAVQARLREVVLNNVEVDDDDEIDLDTPLMQVGITSKTAVTLRNDLAEELPGVNFPFTMVFDFPSISALSDLIIEQA